MAQFTWTADIPAGVLKNNALSKKLSKAAIADAVFYDFTRKESGYGKGKGESITITKFKNLTVPTSAVIGETDKVPIDTFAAAKTDITVEQLARGLEYTDLAQQLSFFDLENPLQRALKDQMSLVIDNLASAAFKTAYVCAIPTSLTNITWDTDGTPTTSATQNLTVAHCGIIRDYLCSPPFPPCGRA
jgi:hypothetical protein